MTPPDAVLDDEDVILLGTSSRLQRQARALRRRRLWVASVVGLSVLTIALAAVNVGLRRSGTASSPTAVAATPSAVPAGATLIAPPADVETPPIAPAETPIVAPTPAPVKIHVPIAVASEPKAAKPAAPAAAPAVAAKKRIVEAVNEAASAAPARVVDSKTTDSAARVAQWMATTYGQADAERRAEQATTLYAEGDERVEHWRRVLAHLRATSAR